jgi:hypothetical protein
MKADVGSKARPAIPPERTITPILGAERPAKLLVTSFGQSVIPNARLQAIVAGSIKQPTGCFSWFANIAQLVEQRFRKAWVVGSIPTVGSSLRSCGATDGTASLRPMGYGLAGQFPKGDGRHDEVKRRRAQDEEWMALIQKPGIQEEFPMP